MTKEFLARGQMGAYKDVAYSRWGGPVVAVTVTETFSVPQVISGYSYGALCTIEVEYLNDTYREWHPQGANRWKALYGLHPDGRVVLWAN